MNKWIYIGVFLDNRSKELLRSIYSVPSGWKEYYDHMTVVFNDGTTLAEYIKSANEKYLNTRFILKVVGVGISEKAMAVMVELPEGIVCANKIPHITLGVSLDGKPVDSNYIINWNTIWKPFSITGEMKVYCGKVFINN